MDQNLYCVLVEKNLPCRLRDGVILYADIYRPEAEGKFPVLLHRTPYNKENIALGIGSQIHPLHAAGKGYVVIVQDVRGRYSSQGTFDVFVNENRDGYDTIQWAASLPFSNGKVGMFGGSYTGVTQILAAAGSPPQLVAMSPRETGSNYFEGWTYQGGAFMLGFNLLWSIELAMDEVNRSAMSPGAKKRTIEEMAAAHDRVKETCSPLSPNKIEILRKFEVAKYFYNWLEHPTYDEFWKQIDAEIQHHKMSKVASLHFAGWYDIFLKGSIRNYLGMTKDTGEARGKQRLIIGPWVHGTDFSKKIGEWNSGFLSEGSALGVEQIQFKWFDHWLKREENGVTDEPPVLIFVMGENRWRAENEWPLVRTKFTTFYMHSGGHGNTLNGDGTLSAHPPENDEPVDTYEYDPQNPVPTTGGGATGAGVAALPNGVYDQRPIEMREDLLVYTGQILDKDTEVTGPVQARLFASSSEVDTDFTVKLVDVHPDGYARNLCDGIIRARFRESLERPELMEPGRVYEISVDLVATSNVFQKGHRIRIEVSSSNFPKFDRNPNTGFEDPLLKGARKAIQTIYHSEERESQIILPIIPRGLRTST